MFTERLQQQIQFILEIDKLKSIMRRSYLLNGERHENSAEHSWHLAIMAILLHEYANEKVNLLQVLKIVLVHDLVEIDAGDTYCYDAEANSDKAAREQKAADRLFAILPEEQKDELRKLWEEFEERSTPEAKFANALDRLMPMMHNYYSQGRSWKEHGVVSDNVFERNSVMREGSEELWKFAHSLIEDAVEKGYLVSSNKNEDMRDE
jgi:putative hydrolase of HD superfamily